MNYRARHAAPGIGAKTAARGAAVAGAAAIAAGAGVIGTGAPASAAGPTIWAPLIATLSASQDNASATWTADGNIALKVGTDTSDSWAQMSLNLNQEEINPEGFDHERPVTPPSFTTDNFGGNSSPRWVLMLHNGNYLYGYPAQSASTGATGANDTFTGPQWQAVVDGSFYNGGAYMTYQDALVVAGDLDGSIPVDSASIVADADQAPGSVDTLTNIQYGGATVGGGTVAMRAVTTQDATVGTAFSLKDAGTTTSSDTNLTYNASGLPSGLGINASTGTISGTPGESGQYAVTVSATDVYGTKAYQHFVLDVSNGVTYTTFVSARGTINNKLSGKCMDVAGGDFAPGGLIQQWTCGAAVKGVNGADQQFQIVTIKGSDNSTKGYLEAISPSGQVFYVTPTSGAKNAQLELTTSRTTADDMAKSGPYYTFPNTGLVADDAGQSKVNGAKVIGYQQDNGTNQQWSMP